MRILLLNHNPINYGTYYRCFNLGRQLSYLDHNVTLICASEKDFDLHISNRRVNGNFDIFTLPRVRYHRYYTGQGFRAILGSLYSLFLKYDVIHSFAVAQPPTGVPTLISKAFRKGSVICDWDDLWSGGFAEYHNQIVKKALETLEEIVPLMAADKVTVVSDLLLRRAGEIGLRKQDIFKIPNGADIKEIKPLDKKSIRKRLGLDTRAPMVVSMGHTYLRGLTFLFKAFLNVIDELNNAKLLMVGEVELPPQIQDLYEEMAGDVVLVGERPYEEVPYYLAAADVLVLPMEDSLIERARWPIRLGDYLASGRPIVSNAVGEVRKVLEEDRCGVVAPANDIGKFSEEILKVLMDEDLQEKLGERARRVAEEKYSWAKIAERLSNVYKLAS
ncbi:MAG: glycosyltransferase family 4 protein [Candidatus Geothermarchaeales archaeon]